MKQLCERMDISNDLDANDMFGILDINDKGELKFEELAEALMRLRGSRHRLHSALLQKDLVRGTRTEKELAERLAQNLRDGTQHELEATGEKLIKKLEKMQEQLPVLLSSLP